MKWFKGLLINIQFFTSIPIPIQLPMDKEHLEKSIKTFPLLGLFQGFIYAALFYLFMEWLPFSALTASFVVWLAMILITGGIHLDGWMDASDAFFSYRDQSKRLEIMKDPRVGAFGVMSIIVLLSAKFFFIYEITLMTQVETFFLIACIPFFSRMVMGVVLLKVKAAKKDGLGTMFKEAAKGKTLWIYPLYILLLLLAVVLWLPNALLAMIVFSLTAIIVFNFIKRKTVRWFGGMTGDVLGASVEGVELSLWMILWLLHYIAMA